MLKSCKYCGRVHEENFSCDKKPIKQKHRTNIDYFRNSTPWKKKRENIKKRDNYMCQICIRKLFKTDKIYNYFDIQVHHAIPIVIDYDKRLDDDNLLSLCPAHHAMAERGEIPYKIIKKVIDEQNDIPPML